MRIFFGMTSDCCSGVRRMRRHRLRSATAIARFASSCPTMCALRASTTCCGVMLKGSCHARGDAESEERGTDEGAVIVVPLLVEPPPATDASDGDGAAAVAPVGATAALKERCSSACAREQAASSSPCVR